MAVVWITTTAGFEKLRPHWNRLLERSYRPEIFRTWEWLFTWWESFATPEDQLAIATVQHGAEVLAIAPMYLQEREGLVRTERRLRLLGDRSVGSDFLDWIVPWPDEQRLTAVLLDAMLAEFGRGVVYDLLDVAADSAVARRVVPLLSDKGWVVKQAVRYHCPYLQLPPTVEEFEKRLSPRTRESLRRKLRKLGNSGRWELWHGGKEIALEDALRLLWVLHDRRWEGREGDSTRREGFREFHARLLNRMREEAQLVLLRLDGRPIAAQYNFRYLDKLYQYQSGFDPEFAALSPGMVLMLLVLREAIEDSVAWFEMLRGEEGYKGHFARSRRITYRVLAGSSVLALSRDLLPQTLRQAKRTLLSRLGKE